MDFDDPEQIEEDVGFPTGSSYEMPTPNSPPRGASAGGSGHGQGEAAGPVSGNRKASQGRYRECLRNHAVGIGSHALDGCGEFLAAGEEGTLDALRCAACGCHRNFHRKEAEGATGARGVLQAATGYHHQFSPFYRTTAQYLHHQQHQPLPPHHSQIPLAFAVAAQHQRLPPPLALPSTSSARGGRGGQSRGGEEQEGASDPMMGLVGGGSNGVRASVSGSGSHKKRFRTKFTAEQKDKMLAFAERVGWRIQKEDEVAVQQLCEEASIKRHVLKVWMHNNKHTLGKRPPS